MSRAFFAGVLIAVLVVVPSPTAAAQEEIGCQPGASPQFTSGFAALKAEIGDDMGEPVSCEFADPNGTGDVHQSTSTGLAFWRKSTNTPTFTNGFDHWADTPDGWVTWTGAGVDPPTEAQAPASPSNVYPDLIVQSFVRGCAGQGADEQRQSTCNCAINRIQETYTLAEFLDISTQIIQQGTMPPAFTNLVVQCVLDQR